jgi:hypothetical protein
MSEKLKLLYVPGARKLHVVTPGVEELAALCGRELHEGSKAIGDLKPDSDICKGCTDAVAAIILVKRPDPKTGELVEELRAPAHFKPEKVELVSQSFRQRLLAGERPGLIWPGKENCPVEPGREIEVGSGVTITVYRIKATKGGDHRGYYTVDDDRPALPRRTPQMFQPPETDQYGDPISHTAESIAAATIDGNYTQDPKQAVTGVGPEVDVEYRRVLGTKTKAKEATRKREEDPMGEMDQDLKRLNRETREIAKRAAKMGIDPTIALAPVLRAAADAHAQLSAERAAA